MEQQSIAKTLKRLIEVNRTNPQALSTNTGISPTTIYSMLHKTTNQANLEHLETIAAYFGTDISIFCGYEEYQQKLHPTKDEEVFLRALRNLNADGQERALGYLLDLKDTIKYKR